MDRDARLLAAAGAFLLLVSLLNGFAAHAIALTQQALTAHVAGLIGAGLLFGLSSLWPRLALGRGASTMGAVLAVYGFSIGWLLNFIAAITGHFGLFPISMSPAHGNGATDAAISVALMSVALALLGLCAILIGGLPRTRP